MFERYTEPARRTLFFARYEASQYGSVSMEADHLLLGLLREKKGPAARWLKTLPLDTIRADLVGAVGKHPRVPTHVEIPFSTSAKGILTAAAEEADALRHRHIGTEHLLLALVRDEQSRAGAILAAHWFGLADLRRRAVDPGESQIKLRDSADVDTFSLPGDFAARDYVRIVDRVLDALERNVEKDAEARELLARIRQHLETLKTRFER